MAKQKKITRCKLCGEILKGSLRYRPDYLNGRYIFVCPECVKEAEIGKFGEDRKRYIPNTDVSYYKGKRVRNK